MTSELCRQKSTCRQNDKSPHVGEFLRNSAPVRRGGLAYGVALIFFLLAAPTLHAAQPNQLTPEQIAEGWINLFDGETLFGWTPTSDANWKVVDGAINVSEGEPGFLATTAEFADYELHVEFKAPATTNSGVFLRTPLEPNDPTKDCYEVNIAPKDNPFPTGSLVGRHRIMSSGKEPLEVPSFAEAFERLKFWDGEWHSFKLRALGANVAVEIEKTWFETHDVRPVTCGHIALQFREGPVAFRNIRLKPLGLKPMLNGKDLTGWNTDRTEASKFEVVADDGRGRESFATGDSDSKASPPVAKDSRPISVLHVTGGRGQLETEATYGDFIMQLDCRVDGDGLNSGVFYRCIPRDMMNGYECQIHNAKKDNDPTKPADFGTGAIYRRVPARKVVSKDHEWFTMTLVPTGPHVSVWVNGYQVTDWTDTRPEHDNPRNGLRLKPGTIALQGHDPTTNLRFRKMRIAELPPNNDELPNDE